MYHHTLSWQIDGTREAVRLLDNHVLPLPYNSILPVVKIESLAKVTENQQIRVFTGRGFILECLFEASKPVYCQTRHPTSFVSSGCINRCQTVVFLFLHDFLAFRKIACKGNHYHLTNQRK